jgi:hypothetical protein
MVAFWRLRICLSFEELVLFPPRNIICSTDGKAAKGKTYLLHDYAPGFWRADLGSSRGESVSDVMVAFWRLRICLSFEELVLFPRASTAKGKTYLLHDYAPGFWRADLGFDFFPTKIRIYNTVQR